MRPNGLLNVVSIIIIVISVIGIVLGLMVSVLGGAVLGAAAESLGLGLAVGSVIGVFVLAGSVYNLVAGILGVKAKFTACKVLGIISVVCGCVSLISALFVVKNASSITTAVAGLVLPVLYVWGAFKGPAE